MVKEAKIVNSSARKKRNITIIFMILVLGFITLMSSIRVVGTGQVGVVTQFGKVTGRELDEGLSFVLPWGLNSVAIYDVKVQKETVRSTAASKDLQDVSSQIVLNYRLDRGTVSTVHQTIGMTYVDKIINPAINEVFKAASAQYTASELITERNRVKNGAQVTLSERLKPYGITVEELSITDFQFSDNFSRAIEEKQVAQQNAERAKFNLEAAITDAEAQRVQAQTLSSQYLQLKAIEKWDGVMPEYLGGGAVFNIPLQ
jgi:prohibitin 2